MLALPGLLEQPAPPVRQELVLRERLDPLAQVVLRVLVGQVVQLVLRDLVDRQVLELRVRQVLQVHPAQPVPEPQARLALQARQVPPGLVLREQQALADLQDRADHLGQLEPQVQVVQPVQEQQVLRDRVVRLELVLQALLVRQGQVVLVVLQDQQVSGLPELRDHRGLVVLRDLVDQAALVDRQERLVRVDRVARLEQEPLELQVQAGHQDQHRLTYILLLLRTQLHLKILIWGLPL